MKNFVLPFFLLVSFVTAQPMTWKNTNYSYTDNPSRINDLFFLDPLTGFAVNGRGQINKTTNGGNSWTRQLNIGTYTHFRSVGFFDSLKGYAGALGWGDPNNTAARDTAILYKTTNGGTSWVPEPQLTSATIERGFCGMHVFNDSIIYAVGRVRGPAWFYKTTDRGATWIAKDMNGYAGGLIDVRFMTKDSGYAVGLTDTTHTSSRGIILSTTDAGETWDTVHVTTRTNEWAWKITFPSRKIGYVSLQRNSNVAPVYILKTTDGGATWKDKLFSATGYFVQGIGFLNDTVGFAGGTSLKPKVTTNGGESWDTVTIGNSLNRFRTVNDTLMYVGGSGVWKYSPSVLTTIGRIPVSSPASATLRQNYPNPFNPQTTIEFSIPEAGFTTISVFDITGQWIRTLYSDYAPKGTFSVSWDGRIESDEEAASGTYFYRMETNNFTETKKMILLR